MGRGIGLLVAGLLVGSFASPPSIHASEQTGYANGTVYVDVTDTTVAIGNALVERSWGRDGFGTTSFERADDYSSSASFPGAPDFRLEIGGAEIESTDFSVSAIDVTEIDTGLRLELTLDGVSFDVIRSIEVYEGIAGFRTETSVISPVPLALSGYTIDELQLFDAAPTIHAFRAGADWRDPDWTGPRPDDGDECMEWCPVTSVGDPHVGTWRETHTAPAGQPLSGPGEWISLEYEDDNAFMVMERNDFPSSRVRYDGQTAALVVDHSRDIVSAGPFEENVHAENPQPQEVGRVRTVRPDRPFELEAAFTGLALDTTDEAWQFHKYLTRERLSPYVHDITFNSNGTDSNVISTGAKDDVDMAVVRQIAPRAKALGIETFILDDGWQSNSGDWYPDCPGHVDYRNKYPPRFPDCDFTAVRDAIAPMKLGLWMSPMHLNPRGSETFQEHPDWACWPINGPLTAYNVLQPDSSSNEAGVGMWGPDAITGGTLPAGEHSVEWWIRNAIEDWQVKYFKFDFLAWADCAGQGDLYEYKEAFTAMLDRLIAAYPDVTFSIDETNDYRLFPFESVTRGPSWFQNGSPPPHQLLHNLWNLSPYIPTYYVGQHFLGGGQWQNYPVDTLMAAALTSHMTFFSDLRQLPDPVVQQAAPWASFYKANREAFGQLVYPLLEDPLEKKWTALQSWNPEEGFGALLAFRQDAADATKTIALENVPVGRAFDLFQGPTGAFIGTVTSEQLSSGLEVTLDDPNTAKVLVIRPHVEA